MGVSQRVKTKYVFRLPIPFLKAKRMNVKGDRLDDDDTNDTNDNVYAVAGASVPHTVRVRYDSEPESESDVGSDEDVGVDGTTDIDPLDTSVSAAPRHRQIQRMRIVSWHGVQEQARSRWTMEQEAKLEHARTELARCQKAWSSEQEVWLQCVSVPCLSVLFSLSVKETGYAGLYSIEVRIALPPLEKPNLMARCGKRLRLTEADR
ncbi:hypothetical protein BDV10DRAFT_185356 [Aspergillus recurvatus]